MRIFKSIMILHLFFSIYLFQYLNIQDTIYLNQEKETVIPAETNNSVFKFVNVYLRDTTKLPDTPKMKTMYYVIAGSFLIPSNAGIQREKLNKLGFHKSYRFNFPESEFYSVVVDTFKNPLEYTGLLEQLKKCNVPFFIKSY